jgi:hypothetical protein
MKREPELPSAGGLAAVDPDDLTGDERRFAQARNVMASAISSGFALGSTPDISQRPRDVRFSLKSRHPLARCDVSFGPEADFGNTIHIPPMADLAAHR